jgi:hypothetical protein
MSCFPYRFLFLANALLMLPLAIEEEIRKTPKPKDAIIPFGTFFCVAN